MQSNSKNKTIHSPIHTNKLQFAQISIVIRYSLTAKQISIYITIYWKCICNLLHLFHNTIVNRSSATITQKMQSTFQILIISFHFTMIDYIEYFESIRVTLILLEQKSVYTSILSRTLNVNRKIMLITVIFRHAFYSFDEITM